MKFTPDNSTHIYSKKVRIGIFSRDIPKGLRWVTLIILVFALVACSPSKRALSGAEGDSQAIGTTGTPPKSSGTAGGAVLNLERNQTYDYQNGSDIQHEVGAIKLDFSKAKEEGFLLVEGTGKTDWTEVTNFPGCSYTAKTEGKVNVTGIFSPDDCMFHLTINTEFSQPTTTYESQDPETCSGSIHFTQTKFSSQIVLDPATSISKETKSMNIRETSIIKLSDLKSDEVNNCFRPVEINRSTPAP